MPLSIPSRHRSGLLLVLLLFLLGQASLLLHDTAVSAHAAGGDCPLCLLAASGGATLPAATPPLPAGLGVDTFAVAALPVVLPGRPAHPHRARAPPLST